MILIEKPSRAGAWMFVAVFLALSPAVLGDAVSDVVITEIMYHPPTNDKRDEYIELHNMSATEDYDLGGWWFEDGVDFTFPAGTVLLRGGYLAVCADEDRIRQLHGIANTVGDWSPETGLSRGGERIRLLDAAGVEIEDVRYDDRNPWPILADGYGRSLEKRNPAGDNDDPANWGASSWSPSWFRVSHTGTATSSTLYIYLSAAGTAYIDDLAIAPFDDPGDDRIENGGFENASLSPWDPNGTHSGSVATTEKAHGGSKSLKVVATGAGSSFNNAVVQEDLGLIRDDQYVLSFWVLLTAEDQTLVLRLSGSDDDPDKDMYVEVQGGGSTPGRQNSIHSADIPPFVYPVERVPEAPTKDDDVRILAVVLDDVGIDSVVLHWDAGAGERTAAMFDDGAHGDGAAADNVYGAEIGRFATGTIVRYWVTAEDTAGQAGRFPFFENPTPVMGFYIEPPGIAPGFAARSNNGLVSARPPVYHLLIDEGYLTPDRLHLADPRTYIRGTFIHDGEVFENVRIRHRGQSSLGTSKKHWKVDFNKDHRFRTPFPDHPEVDNINIQSSYGDKTFLREFLSYKAWIDLGQPGLEMWHVRMYLNGHYRGLFVHMENADEDWLDRTGLDAEGWLWKSYSEAKGGTGGFEMEEDGGNASAANNALGTFIGQMNSLTGASLANYVEANMNVDGFIDFLAIHQLIHNADHPAKNYFVYADEDAPAGTWNYLGWDMDLTHGRNFECWGTSTGPGITYGDGTGVYNDAIRYDFWADRALLFGTESLRKCDGPWNGVINAFLTRTTAFRQRFYDRTADLLDGLYHPDVLIPIIDDFGVPLDDEVDDLDWKVAGAYYGIRNTHEWHLDMLRQWTFDRYSYLADALSDLSSPDLSGLTCNRAGSDVDLAWRNNDTGYTEIRVFRNGALFESLAGTATSTTVPLDPDRTVNTFRVASVYNGNVRSGESCTIIGATGGYAAVIEEDFDPPAGPEEISVNCNAAQVNGVLQLTEPVGNQAGTAFFRAKFPTDDFIADFDLRFDDPSDPGADGMMFAMIRGDDPAICGSAGGAMGFWQGDGGGIVMSGFAVVFDTWENPGEPSHNWVGFIDTGANSTGAVAGAAVPEEFNGQGTFHVRVLGKDGTFIVLMGNESIDMAEREILSHTVPGWQPEDLLFGFTAGTGGATARHIVDDFVLQVKTDFPAPVAAFRADRTAGEAPLTVTFTNESTGAETYSWSFGDGGSSTAASPTHTYETPGSYTVRLTATGPGGTDTEQKAGYIDASLVLEADFTADVTIGTNPLEVRFTDLTRRNADITYAWNFGDGFGSTSASPTHTYRTAGRFDVTLKVTGPGGVTSTKTKSQYILVDDPIVADFSADPVEGRAPLTVDFTDASQGSTIESRLWNFGDGATSTARNPRHTYESPGTYSVVLVVSGFDLVETIEKVDLVVVLPSGASFLRGDSTSDGTQDISDAIAILGFLFTGGEAPACEDAADVNDDGEIDISDPISLLGYLFLGGTPPAPPHPEPGEDPTPDDLAPCSP